MKVLKKQIKSIHLAQINSWGQIDPKLVCKLLLFFSWGWQEGKQLNLSENANNYEKALYQILIISMDGKIVIIPYRAPMEQLSDLFTTDIIPQYV